MILYIDAFVSPAGTGLICSGSSARVSYALGRNGYIPHAFDRLNERGVPWVSILFSFAVGMIVFLPFPGWQKLVSFVTSATVIIFSAQCLPLAPMRRQLPDHERSFRLPAAELHAPLGFVVANLIVLFSGWTTNWKLFAAIGIGLVLLAVCQLSRPAPERVRLDWQASAWIWPWLVDRWACGPRSGLRRHAFEHVAERPGTLRVVVLQPAQLEPGIEHEPVDLPVEMAAPGDASLHRGQSVLPDGDLAVG